MPNLRHWILAVFPLAQTHLKSLVSLTYNLRHWILAVSPVAQLVGLLSNATRRLHAHAVLALAL